MVHGDTHSLGSALEALTAIPMYSGSEPHTACSKWKVGQDPLVVADACDRQWLDDLHIIIIISFA